MELPEPLGRFFVPLIHATFWPGDLAVSWRQAPPNISREQRKQEDAFWQALCRANPRKRLFDGTLCRLMNYRTDAGKIALALGPMSFKTHIHSVNSGGDVLARDPGAFGLGVSTVVLTVDDQLLYIRRSKEVAVSPGLYDVFGGHIDPGVHRAPDDDGARVPSPFMAIQCEIEEELNLPVEQIDALCGIGLIRNRQSGQPELLFRCRTTMPAAALLARAESAADRHEYGEILATGNDRSGLMRLCRDRAGEFSPSGLANLWFHAVSL